MTYLSLTLRNFIDNLPRDLAVFLIVAAVATFGLLVDTLTTLPQQHVLGVLAWGILLGLLKGESLQVRIQVSVVMAVATGAEFLFAPNLHFFAYRFDNIPIYVPPGHGMVYLGALTLSRSDFFRRYHGQFTLLALTIGTLWAVSNVFFTARGDAGGAVLFAVLLVFILVGRTHPLYVAAFFMTAYLEFLGTSYDNWAWASEWPIFGLSQANPPCGISAGYCIFDATGIGGAALIKKAMELVSSRKAILSCEDA